MNDLSKYLSKIEPYTGFAGGDFGVSDSMIATLEEFSERGMPRASMDLAFDAMSIAWQALPADVRNQAISALNNVAGTISQSIGSVPIIGDVINVIIIAFTAISDSHKLVKKVYKSAAKHKLNVAQFEQFKSAIHPTDWIYTAQKIKLYKDPSCTNLLKDCYRTRPCLYPIGNDNAVVGWKSLPKATWSCGSGKEYNRALHIGKYKENSDSKSCDAWCMFSSLFYPFWSPNSAGNLEKDKVRSCTEPLPVYKGNEGDDIFDPNVILIQQQAALLGDSLTNLRADSARVIDIYNGFMKFFKSARIKAVKIDDKYITKNDVVYSGSRYWKDDNGFLNVYGAATQSVGTTMYSDIAHTPDYHKEYWDEYGDRNTSINAGAYNAIVGMTRAFFTARAGFLANTEAMNVFANDKLSGKKIIDALDPAVKNAVKVAATGAPSGLILTAAKVLPQPMQTKMAIPERMKSAKSKKSKKRTGNTAIVAAAAVAGILLLRK